MANTAFFVEPFINRILAEGANQPGGLIIHPTILPGVHPLKPDNRLFCSYDVFDGG